jgi:hypothetical protein
VTALGHFGPAIRKAIASRRLGSPIPLAHAVDQAGRGDTFSSRHKAKLPTMDG